MFYFKEKMQTRSVKLIYFSMVVLLLVQAENVLSQRTGRRFLKALNLFPNNATNIEEGDVLQCEVTKKNVHIPKVNFPVYTEACSGNQCYIFHEASKKKCFSFKVRTQHNPCIILNRTPYLVLSYRIEVLLDFGNTYTAIREINGGSSKHVKTYSHGGFVNEREYNGFWIRWSDDELLEVGRESETTPFIFHRFPVKFEVNYVGILSWGVRGSWLLDAEPICPGTSNTTQIDNMIAHESDCFLLG